MPTKDSADKLSNRMVGLIEGHGVLIRRGLATWSQTRPVARTPPESPFPSGAAAPVLDWFGTELVLLVASLILSTRKEDLLHA